MIEWLSGSPLTTATGFAINVGLCGWGQPRLIGATGKEAIAHLTAVATARDLARANGGEVSSHVGCDLTPVHGRGIYRPERYLSAVDPAGKTCWPIEEGIDWDVNTGGAASRPYADRFW